MVNTILAGLDEPWKFTVAIEGRRSKLNRYRNALIAGSLIFACGCSQSRDLQIRSAGRLPQTFHGFALGTRYADLMAAHRELISSSDSTDRDAQLYSPGYDNPKWGVTVKNGLVDDVTLSVSRISPDVAIQVRRNMLHSFGHPTSSVQLDAGSTVWAWVDGDIRMLLWYRPTGNVCPSDAISVSVELAYWPLYGRSPQSAPSSEFFKQASDVSATWVKSTWGDSPAPFVPQKALRRDHEGVALGMDASQVHAIYPRMTLGPDPQDDQIAGDLSDGPQFLDVKFWQGKVYEIADSHRVAPEIFEASGLALLKWPFGSPREVTAGSCEFVATWADGRTFLNEEMTSLANSSPTITTTLRDILMSQARQAARCLANSNGYAASPIIFSPEFSGRRKWPINAVETTASQDIRKRSAVAVLT